MTELNTKQEKFAQALYNAYVSGKPLNEKDWSGVVNNDATAYAVQNRVMELKQLPVGGYKVSLTSKKTQDMFDSTEPLYGQQVDSHFLPSPATVKLADQMEPLLEVELAFRARQDLNASDSLDDLLHKTTVAGDFEVPQARFKDWFPSLGKYNVMSDCAVGGLVVYGQERPSNEVFNDVAEAAKVKAQLFNDGKKLKEGESSAVLGNPFKSLQWLVGELEKQSKKFKEGQLVSSGTFVLPPTLKKGKWVVKFDHGFGNVVLNVK